MLYELICNYIPFTLNDRDKINLIKHGCIKNGSLNLSATPI